MSMQPTKIILEGGAIGGYRSVLAQNADAFGRARGRLNGTTPSPSPSFTANTYSLPSCRSDSQCSQWVRTPCEPRRRGLSPRPAGRSRAAPAPCDRFLGGDPLEPFPLRDKRRVRMGLLSRPTSRRTDPWPPRKCTATPCSVVRQNSACGRAGFGLALAVVCPVEGLRQLPNGPRSGDLPECSRCPLGGQRCGFSTDGIRIAADTVEAVDVGRYVADLIKHAPGGMSRIFLRHPGADGLPGAKVVQRQLVVQIPGQQGRMRTELANAGPHRRLFLSLAAHVGRAIRPTRNKSPLRSRSP